MDRQLFLERIRRRVGAVSPSPVRTPEEWVAEIEDPPARFERELKAGGRNFHTMEDRSTAEALGPIVEAADGPAVLVAGDGVPDDVEEVGAAHIASLKPDPDLGR